jgi:hypothetical protein|nr:MAG TPA: hypothetical protein [Caudoviricetes sp.]
MRLIDADALWDELTEDLEDGDVRRVRKCKLNYQKHGF